MKSDLLILTLDETLFFPSLVVLGDFVLRVDIHNKLSRSLLENLEEVQVELLSCETLGWGVVRHGIRGDIDNDDIVDGGLCLGELGDEIASLLEVGGDGSSLDLLIDLGAEREVLSDIGGDSLVLVDDLDLELISSVFVDEVVGNEEITSSDDEDVESLGGFFLLSFLEKLFNLGSAHFLRVVLVQEVQVKLDVAAQPENSSVLLGIIDSQVVVLGFFSVDEFNVLQIVFGEERELEFVFCSFLMIIFIPGEFQFFWVRHSSGL